MTAQKVALAIGAFLAIWFGWRLLHPVHVYRFLLTVEARKNGATHAGSSVIELRTRSNFFLSMLPEVPEWETSIHGDAVFVDLGGGDHLIALLAGRNGPKDIASLPSRVVLGDKRGLAGSSGVYDTLSTLHPQALRAAYGRSYALTNDQIPPLIRLKVKDDPLSVERIAPEDAGVTARLELTHDQFNRVILQRMPWLNRFRPDKNLSGTRGSTWNSGEEPFSTPRQINYTDFVAGY